MAVLAGLEPKAVFTYFEEICGVPHGSTNTKEISDYLVEFAKAHGLKYIQDEVNNVIIFKDGTAGYEKSPAVILQGHIDMVCEKESDCNIDFEKDGLKIQVKDGIISADGTTLGGDDGIAVAYAMAILASKDIPHPPIEAVFTVDEEIGMLGAAAMDCSQLKGRIMLNMDSEEEGCLLVSCAGGAEVICHIPVEKKTLTGTEMTLTLTGLTGGHSGVEIDKNRGNASLLLARTLFHLFQQVPFALESLDGGLKDNAIPREATAKIVVEKSQAVEIQKLILKVEKDIQGELATTDPQATLKAAVGVEASYDVMTSEATAKTLCAVLNMPSGIQRMNPDMAEMVQTSLNMGVLKTHEDEVEIHLCVRSSVESEKQALKEKIQCLAVQLGGKVDIVGDYPGWEYNKDSHLREVMVDVFKKQYGHEPIVQGLHAGVECGLFAGKLPGLDCVSFGPNMKDIHTPAESMEVASVQRTWDYTLAILKELK